MCHPARMLAYMFCDLIGGRQLAWQLAVRDIRTQYRQTALGLLLVFILSLILADLTSTTLWQQLCSSTYCGGSNKW